MTCVDLAPLLRRRLPILQWGAEYSGQTLAGDLVAAAIVSMMLIPQSLAYALLVGCRLNSGSMPRWRRCCSTRFSELRARWP
jgi:hypothetical protein